MAETMHVLGVSRFVVREMLRRGVLLGFRAGPGRSRIRITEESVRALLKGRAL